MYLKPIQQYNELLTWLNSQIFKPARLQTFVSKLSKFLNQQGHPVRFKIHQAHSQSLDSQQFTIGGEYDPILDESRAKQFTLYFISGLMPKDIWTVNQDIARELALELTEVLVHEYQHQSQYRKRRYLVNNERYCSDSLDPALKSQQEHYGNPDEIDAYAANIATRLFLLGERINISSVKKINEYKSLDLQHYIKTFGPTHNVVITLFKKIQTNLTQLEDVKNGKDSKRRTTTRNCTRN